MPGGRVEAAGVAEPLLDVAGHLLEPLAGDQSALLPPDAFHPPVDRPVTHTIYRDALHPSRLVLPYTTR